MQLAHLSRKTSAWYRREPGNHERHSREDCAAMIHRAATCKTTPFGKEGSSIRWARWHQFLLDGDLPALVIWIAPLDSGAAFPDGRSTDWCWNAPDACRPRLFGTDSWWSTRHFVRAC